MEDKITIIVPVYNSEKYLENCLQSIIKQTYSNLEIIVINDGSTDSSFNIISEFAQIDNRIVCINRENKGVSASRNEGLKRMTGMYYMFVDSDDTIELDCIEKMYSILKNKNVNAVRCNYKVIKQKETLSGKYIFKDNFFIQSREQFATYFLLDKNTLPCYSVLLLVSAKYKTYFNENIRFMEDTLYYYDLFRKINHIYIFNTELYNYFYNQNSRSNNIKNICNNIDDIIEVNHLFKKKNFPNTEFLNAKHFSIILSYLSITSKLNKEIKFI